MSKTMADVGREELNRSSLNRSKSAILFEVDMIKQCLMCSKDFYIKSSQLKRGRGKFCSKKCQYTSNKIKYKSKGNPFYGKHHTPETRIILSQKKFKRGWSLTQGYIRLYEKDNKGQLLHRFIMEKILGRKLQKNEVVHHINQNRSDNRLENLLVLDRGKHVALHKRLLRNKYHKLTRDE
jgi:hypothetical protein